DQLRDTYLLRGGARRLGHFSIVLDNGVRWLEAHPEGDMPLALAVPQGVIKYLQTETDEGSLPLSSAAPVQVSSVKLAAHGTRARGRLDDNYSRELFRTEFGPLYYRGFVDKAGLPSVRFGQLHIDRGVAPARTRRRAAIASWSSAGALT